MVLKTISPGCRVRAFLMLFLMQILYSALFRWLPEIIFGNLIFLYVIPCEFCRVDTNRSGDIAANELQQALQNGKVRVLLVSYLNLYFSLLNHSSLKKYRNRIVLR